MRKNKPELYLAIFILTVVAATTLLYFETTKNPYGIFPEKLGDMNISFYREGDAAMNEVKSLHGGANFEISNAYIADYRSTSGNKAKFWVSESKDDEEAVSLLEAMKERVGKSGMFSNSTSSIVEGIKVYFVAGQPQVGLYNYFYARGKRVFWIQIDDPDAAYREGILKESIRTIT